MPTNLTISSDFEKAVFNSIRQVFDGAVHTGCRFHFNSAVWKQIQEHGLQPLFHQNSNFQEFVYSLYALAYVPVDHVVRVYEAVILVQWAETLKVDEEWRDCAEDIEEFMHYFATTWVERRGGRAGRFHINSWNMVEVVTSGNGVTTNNMLESFNRTLNSMAGQKPNVWKIHQLFIEQESSTRRTFLLNSTGQDLCENSSRKQQALNHIQRMNFIISNFHGTPSNLYLTAVAHELSNNRAK